MIQNIPDAVDRLQAALDTLARALASGRSDEVLAAEGPIAAAASELAGLSRVEVADRPRLRQALAVASLTLARCRVMGQCADELAASLAEPSVYGRSGQ